MVHRVHSAFNHNSPKKLCLFHFNCGKSQFPSFGFWQLTTCHTICGVVVRNHLFKCAQNCLTKCFYNFFSTRLTKSFTVLQKVAKLTQKVGEVANGVDLKSVSPVDYSQVRYFDVPPLIPATTDLSK